MIGTLFTITNKARPERSITINDRTTTPSKFIALQAYPTMELDLRVDEIPREGQHGIWDFFTFYGKRVIVFEGVIVGDSEADVTEIQNALQRVVELPAQPTTADDGTVIISWTDPLGREVQTEAKIAASPRFSRSMRQLYRLDFFLTLKAADPSIVSQEVYEVDGIRGYPSGDFTLPFELPFSIGTTWVNKFEIENIGSTIADVTIRMYGSLHMPINNPTFTNFTTGVYIRLNVVLNDETEYVSINTRTGEIVDQDGNDLSGYVEVGSAFPRLDIGVNEVIYTSDESVGALSPLVTRVDPDEIVETEHRFGVL